MEILDPAGIASAVTGSLAPRPAALHGAVIGVLDNGKPNAGVLLSRVAASLADATGAAGVRVWRKPSSAVPALAGVLEEITGSCAVALTASAD